VAIEVDAALIEHLRTRWPDLEVLHANALDVDFTRWGAGVLGGNLPYYAATAIISKFLHNPGQITQGVFLIQREVADRITARPGNRDYGYLSVECQLLSHAEYLFKVPPGAFQPPPKVDSAVIRLRPRKEVSVQDPEAFLRFVSLCFRQKRKTLRNNLAGQYSFEHPLLARRAEQLAIADFVELRAAATSGKTTNR